MAMTYHAKRKLGGNLGDEIRDERVLRTGMEIAAARFPGPKLVLCVEVSQSTRNSLAAF